MVAVSLQNYYVRIGETKALSGAPQLDITSGTA
jgi:hypothetical protein